MLRLARPLGNVARRQLLVRSFAQPIRGYAERNDSMLSSDPSFKPEQPVPSTPTRTAAPIVPSATPATPASTTPIPPANIPKEPPPPPQTVVTPPPPGSTPPSNPKIEPAPVTPPPPPPKKRSRVRLLFYLLLLTSLGYAGAVAYALRSDNFHDFFTEYVPFGEDIVLYFEERAFRQRFPNAQANKYRATTVAKDEDKKITIPLRSGLSSREVKEPSGSDVTTKGSHMSAVEDNKAAVTPKKIETQKDTSAKKESNAVAAAKSDAPAAAKKESKPATATPVKESKPEPAPTTDDRKPLIAPVTQISPLAVPNAEEPVVQDLVKIVNDLITVINADSTPNTNKYSQPMQKAKDALTQVASQISTLRAAERQAAEERVREAHKEFDEGARTLLERMAVSQREDEIKYREEWDQERSKLASQYENRVKSEVERTQQVLEARHKNDLEELALKMKKDFISSIHSLVESERDNRLSKLSDLSSNVDNLTSLTSNWNGVIDANLATQKLQVAVDAVRSTIENSNATHRPTPFVREMAALKLVADSDPLVDAAIASVPPAAYQRGIPSTAQLIERFRRVAGEVRKASLLPSDAGIASHAASAVLSKVMFSKKGVPQGDDVESILTRTETLLEEGDLDAAAREMNDLKGWPGVLSRDWLGDVRKVLEVKQALEVVETEARLRCLRVE